MLHFQLWLSLFKLILLFLSFKGMIWLNTSKEATWFFQTFMVCYYLLNYVGHAIAGGCVLALNCDSRIMVNGKFKIGLNEAKLGLVVPFW